MIFTLTVNPDLFRFKEFGLAHNECAHKIGTDGVLLGAWVSTPTTTLNILDIGSGSGLISFMMAQRFSQAQILGIELDLASHQQSLQNLNINPWKRRINFKLANFLTHDFEDQKFDLILSNPPFFKTTYLSGSERRDQARHEFSLPHHKMILKCKSLLKPNGKLAMVLPVEEAQDLIEFSILFPNRICKVQNTPTAAIKRYLMEFSLNETITNDESLSIRDTMNSYSKEYKDLTQGFYLNF